MFEPQVSEVDPPLEETEPLPCLNPPFSKVDPPLNKNQPLPCMNSKSVK